MEVLSREPSPGEASEMIDNVNHLLDQLRDEELKQIAQVESRRLDQSGNC